MKNRSIAFAVAFACTVVAAGAQPGLPTKEVLTLAVSERIVEAAAADARRSDARVVIAVVDDAGYLIVLKRLPGGERPGGHRQGPDRGDLPPAQPGHHSFPRI